MPAFMRSIPDGDDRERQVRKTCGYAAYDNPKIIVGAVSQPGARVLSCRRAIEPSRGYRTLPAGDPRGSAPPDRPMEDRSS